MKIKLILQRFVLMLYVTVIPDVMLAQSDLIKTEFKEISLYYSQLEAFSVDVNMFQYDNKGAVIIEQSGCVCRTKNFHYVNFGGVTHLMRNGESVMANEGNKTIIYSQYDKHILKEIIQEMDVSAILDSLWDKQRFLTYKIVNKTENTLLIQISDRSDKMYDSIEILIDYKLNQILSLNYNLIQTETNLNLSRIEINYSNETDKPALNREKYTVEYYLESSKNKVRLSQKYNSYYLIDQTKNLY